MYCISTSAACTDILLPVMFNDTSILLICEVFAYAKCRCFYKVDFSGFILFEMTLKLVGGRERERGGGREREREREGEREREKLFPFCTFFCCHFAAQTPV